jgi:hypothetical protein
LSGGPSWCRSAGQADEEVHVGQVRKMGGALIALGLIAVSASLVEAAKKSCAQKLGSQVYSCTVAAEGGGTFQDCLRFSSPGTMGDFDLRSDAQGLLVGCSCKGKGSSKKPKFEALPIFVCSGSDNEGEYLFEGNVSGSGKKLSKGVATNGSGGSFVFDCKVDPACAVAQ